MATQGTKVIKQNQTNFTNIGLHALVSMFHVSNQFQAREDFLLHSGQTHAFVVPGDLGSTRPKDLDVIKASVSVSMSESHLPSTVLSIPVEELTAADARGQPPCGWVAMLLVVIGEGECSSAGEATSIWPSSSGKQGTARP